MLIQIQNNDTNEIFLEVLDADVKLNFNYLSELIISYDPQIQKQFLCIMSVQNDIHKFVTELTQLPTKAKWKFVYRCFYDLDEIELNKLVTKDETKLKELNNLINQIKQKYENQTLDINLFWACPREYQSQILDKVVYKPIEQQPKYAYYINAITTQVEKSSNKKIQLNINPFNSTAFERTDVFKIVYLICHVEVDSPKGSQKQLMVPMQKCESYIYGQRADGLLQKISPQQLDEQLKQKMYKIDLLIFHSSYPYCHLAIFEKRAKNIILINSNPFYVQVSTAFYLQQLFSNLLQGKQINDSHDLAYTAVERALSQSKAHDEIFEEFKKDPLLYEDEHSRQLSTCCCYHDHRQNCLWYGLSNRFTKAHWWLHVNNCQCEELRPLEHSCAEKREIVQKKLKTVAKKQCELFYTCCCKGYQLGVYQHIKYNQLYEPERANWNRDPHAMKCKYVFNQIEKNKPFNVEDGELGGDVGEQFLKAFKYHVKHSLIGNKRLIQKLLRQFMRRNTSEHKIINIIGEPYSGKKYFSTWLANLLICKKKFRTISIISFAKESDLKILENANSDTFYLLIDCRKKQNRKPYDSLAIFSPSSNSKPFAAILVSQYPVLIQHFSIIIQTLDSLDKDQFRSYIHARNLIHNAQIKKKIFKLVKFTFPQKKNYDKGLFPSEVNQFQILNLIKYTSNSTNEDFQNYLQNLKAKQIVEFYFFASMIKYSVCFQQRQLQTEQFIINFLKNYEGNKITVQICFLNQIINNFLIIPQILAQKLSFHTKELMHIFIKNSASSILHPNQLFQATTIDRKSFLHQSPFIETLIKINPNINYELNPKDLNFQIFNTIGIEQIQRNNQQLNVQHENIKQFLKRLHECSNSVQVPTKCVVVVGLNFLRIALCSHLIYSGLNFDQKLELIICGTILINNAIILMKSINFFKIKETIINISNSNLNEDSPKLFSTRSCNQTIQLNRKTSFQQLQQRKKLSQNQASPLKKLLTNPWRQDNSKNFIQEKQTTTQKLNAQITDLATYKGLLFLISQLCRRARMLKERNFHQAQKQREKQKIKIILIALSNLAMQIKIEQTYGSDTQAVSVQKQKTRLKFLERISRALNDRSFPFQILNEEQKIWMIDRYPWIKPRITFALIMVYSRCGRIALSKAANKEMEHLKGNLMNRSSTLQDSQNNNYRLPKVLQLSQTDGFSTSQLYDDIICYLDKNEREVIENTIKKYSQLLQIFHQIKNKVNSRCNLIAEQLFVAHAKLMEVKVTMKQRQNPTCLFHALDYIDSWIRKELQDIRKKLIVVVQGQSEYFLKNSLRDRLNELQREEKQQFQFILIKLSKANLLKLQLLKSFRYLVLALTPWPKDQKYFMGWDGQKQELLLQVEVFKQLRTLQWGGVICCIPNHRNSQTQETKHFISLLLQDKNLRSEIVYFFLPYQIALIPVFKKLLILEVVMLLLTFLTKNQCGQVLSLKLRNAFYLVRNSHSFQLKNQFDVIYYLNNQQFKKIFRIHPPQEQIQNKQYKEIKIVLNTCDQINKQKMTLIQNKLKNNLNSKNKQFKVVEFTKPIELIEVVRLYLKQFKSYTRFFCVQLKKIGKQGLQFQKYIQKLSSNKFLDALHSSEKISLFIYALQIDHELLFQVDIFQKNFQSQSNIRDQEIKNRKRCHKITFENPKIWTVHVYLYE